MHCDAVAGSVITCRLKLLANLSRDPNFPVAIPRCLYADIEQKTLTGIIVTERIAYGEGAIERHYPKCMDQILPEPVAHYRALVSSLAQLAGAHRSGAREVPDPSAAIDRYDPVFTANETARVQLKITIALLNMWHRHDLGRLLQGNAP